MALVGSISATLFAAAVQATLIPSGTINSGNLTTNPSTTSQISVEFGVTTSGNLRMNANSTGNGFPSDTGNFSGSVGAAVGTGGGDNRTIVLHNGREDSFALATSRAIILAAKDSANLNNQNSGSAKTTASDSSVQANSNFYGAAQLNGVGSDLRFADRIQVRSSTNYAGSAQTSNGDVAQTNGKADSDRGDNATGTVTATIPNSQALTNSRLVGNTNGAESSTNTDAGKIQTGATATANGNASGAHNGISIGSKNDFHQDARLNGNVGTITGDTAMNGEVSSAVNSNLPSMLDIDGDLNGSLQHGLLNR